MSYNGCSNIVNVNVTDKIGVTDVTDVKFKGFISNGFNTKCLDYGRETDLKTDDMDGILVLEPVRNFSRNDNEANVKNLKLTANCKMVIISDNHSNCGRHTTEDIKSSKDSVYSKSTLNAKTIKLTENREMVINSDNHDNCRDLATDDIKSSKDSLYTKSNLNISANFHSANLDHKSVSSVKNELGGDIDIDGNNDNKVLHKDSVNDTIFSGDCVDYGNWIIDDTKNNEDCETNLINSARLDQTPVFLVKGNLGSNININVIGDDELFSIDAISKKIKTTSYSDRTLNENSCADIATLAQNTSNITNQFDFIFCRDNATDTYDDKINYSEIHTKTSVDNPDNILNVQNHDSSLKPYANNS